MTHSGYSNEQIAEMKSILASATSDFDRLFLAAIKASYSEKNTKVQRYLRHGIARRLRLIHRQTESIFSIIPTDSTSLFNEKQILDAQTFIQAIVHNIHGLFDTFAWAIVLRNQKSNIEINHKSVGIKKRLFTESAPSSINEYVKSESFSTWYDHITQFRDSLAHRIPLYIPPAELSQSEQVQYCELEKKEIIALAANDISAAQETRNQIASLGKPCFHYTTISKDCETEISSLIHPQVLSDCLLVIEFSKLFFAYWNAEYASNNERN